MRRRVLEVEMAGYASLVRGPGARELVVEVKGRPPMWVALARGYSVSEKTARDVICAADLRGYIVVVTGPRGQPEPVPVNERFPGPFEGLGFTEGRDLAIEAVRIAGSAELVTLSIVEEAKRDIWTDDEPARPVLRAVGADKGGLW